jgi:DDE superfamily endonuclease/Archaeal putative transposase ISC1217
MWCMIDSLQTIVDDLSAAFTRPSFRTAYAFLLGWIMCLGKHTLGRVARSAQPHTSVDNSQRHGLDGYYNFFERSAWTATGLAYRLAVLVLTRLKFFGRITLLVDDTLAHKRGKSVWGMGWWRDAVASTKKRVATASGHNWVVLAVAYCLPCSNSPILALPLLARLHQPGQGQPSCATLAKEMLAEVLAWFPKHCFTLVGDGAYACKELLGELDQQRVVFVGRLRGDACVYDPQVPKAKSSKRGRKAQKGPKLPKPKEAAAKADRKRNSVGPWLWQGIEVTVYGESRNLSVVRYLAVWPRVLGLRPIQIVVVRDPESRMNDCYLFTTDLQATTNWVVTQFAWRWAIEVLFRASKQVLDIEAPQHWSQESVQKVAPWVWSMQSVVMVWYLTAGQTSPEALELREVMGAWDSEWSLRHMLQVLRRAILNATINPNSADPDKLTKMVETLKNWVNLAA